MTHTSHHLFSHSRLVARQSSRVRFMVFPMNKYSAVPLLGLGGFDFIIIDILSMCCLSNSRAIATSINIDNRPSLKIVLFNQGRFR